MLKKIAVSLFAALAYVGVALAQTQGPTPPPSPWTVNGATISYTKGGVLVGTSLTTQGIGTINVSGNYYRNGAVASTVVNGVNCAIGGTCTITAVANAIQSGVTLVNSASPTSILYNNSGFLSHIVTANNGVLVTSAGGVPTISSTIPSATQDNITRVGTLVSGATSAGFTVALSASTVTGTLGYANGGTNASTQVTARNNIFPTPTRAGDISYWNGSAWVSLAGNNSGTQVLSENASGVPAWITASGTGTVTSVAMTVPAIFSLSGSPITSSGTLAVTLATQSANTVFAGPTSGGATTPAFRALVNADFPSGFVVAGTGLTGGSLSGGGTIAIDAAIAADYFAGTANKVITAGIIYQAETATTFGATTTFNFQTFINTAVTMTGNITTQTLQNVIAGKAGTIRFIQDATGSRSTVWSTVFKFPGGTTPTLTTTPAAIDVLNYNCITATYCQASLAKDVK